MSGLPESRPPVIAVIRVTGVTEYWPRLRRSLRLDARELHHLAPLLGLICDELSKVGGRERKHIATDVGKLRLQLGIGERGVDLPVELVDDLGRRIFGRAEAIHRACLVAWDELADG